MNDVLDAVARLGLECTSLRALARELGISPRMLLYHFGSRDGLLDAVVAETSRRLAEQTALLEGDLPAMVMESWAWMTEPHQRSTGRCTRATPDAIRVSTPMPAAS